jgi:hypothetical protein
VPFTFAHAAAAVPFQRTHLVLSALVVGCFAPDFEYFLRLSARGGFGHTVPGLFLLDLPLALLVLWLFHAFARKPLLSFLPRRLQNRLQRVPAEFPLWGPARLALILASILIGGATHILWDSFTHPNYWPYQHWEILSYPVPVPIAGSLQLYKLLQHGSTIFGCIVLFIWIKRWYDRTPPGDRPLPQQRTVTALVVVSIAVIGAILRAFIGVGIPTTRHAFGNFLIDFVVTSITFFWLQLLLLGAASSIRANDRQKLTRIQ